MFIVGKLPLLALLSVAAILASAFHGGGLLVEFSDKLAVVDGLDFQH